MKSSQTQSQVGNRISTSLDMSQDQQRLAQTQPLGFFASLSQSIFGGGSNSNAQNAQNQAFLQQQSMNQQAMHSRGSSADPMLGRPHLQIFLDVQGFKNYTRQPVTDDTTVAEIIKTLKSKYAVNQSQHQNSGSKGLNTSSGSHPSDKHLYHSQLSLGATGSSTSISKNLHTSANKSMKPDSYKEDYGLFLINTKAQTPLLMARRLVPHDQVLKVYQRSLEVFRKDGEDRFRLCFVKLEEVEQLIRMKAGLSAAFDEDTHVAYQLGKSIINNKTYERKGKLYKKSLNSDKFKERQFVLDKEQLFYFKNEKQKDKNFNLIMLTNAAIYMARHPKQKYCFEIENDNRKYLLSSKSEYDLNQWFFAIQDQIRLSRDNKNIADVNQSITLREKDIAQSDMSLIQRIFKPKNVIFNPVQPLLLDFINDPFINELLPNLTKYVTLVREPDYQRHALDKAKDVVQQLKAFQKKLQNSKANESGLHFSKSQTKALDDENSESISVQLSKVQSMQHQNSTNDDYRRYKELKPEHKIEQIFSEEDMNLIQSEYEKMLKDSQDPSKALQMNPRLLNNILLKINRIIKYNYLEEFFREKKVELLSIPTMNYKMNMTQLGFNSIGPNHPKKGNKNVNIFEAMLLSKGGVIAQPYQNNGHRRLQSQQSSNLDPAFQQQIKQFIGSMAQQDERSHTITQGITKVQNQ